MTNSPPRRWSHLRPDNFTLTLFTVVLLATFAPIDGRIAQELNRFTDVAIAALFFLHGARLPRESVVAGLLHWRLHGVIIACTFFLFPLLGLMLRPLSGTLLTPELYIGVLLLCCLPSTVQASVAFTAMAGGNVPAAVCAAALSSLLGVFLTPLLMSILAGSQGALSDPWQAASAIVMQLLVPFVIGHLLRPWIGPWVLRQRALLRYTDQGIILLVVYAAFAQAVNEGLWHSTPLTSLLVAAFVAVLLLAFVIPLITWLARRLRFSTHDEIPIVFCGSKKSLISGVPIARVLFADAGLGAIVLPLMIYHQLQLILCALVAQRYARKQQPTHT